MCKASRRDVLTGVLGPTASQAFLLPALKKSAAAQELPQNAAAIVAAIRDKRMTATDAVKAALARAEQMKHLNAIITLNADGALAAARKIDEAVAAGRPLPPLILVPVLTGTQAAAMAALLEAEPQRVTFILSRWFGADRLVDGKEFLTRTLGCAKLIEQHAFTGMLFQRFVTGEACARAG